MSYLLLSLDCRQILVPVRLLHRYRKTLQVHLQVQQQRDSPKTQNKERDGNRASGDRLRDLQEWPGEFAENLEETEVPAPAPISHDPDSERPARVAPRKHIFFTHFPKDRNCEVCLRTNMTRALCRRRIGEALHRAEKFGDMTTVDHKVLSDNCESRNNHR